MAHVYVDLQMDKPTYRYRIPKTDLEARYSLSYGIAAALLDGELTLEQYTDQRVHSADCADMMERIVDVPAEGDAQQNVVIELRDGSRLEKRIRYSKGHPLHDIWRRPKICAKSWTCW